MRGTLVLQGILNLVVGVVAVAWPDITVGAFVILFAVYAFLAGVMEAVAAFRAESVGPVAGRVLLALLNIVAGVVALAWPGITALVIVLWVAAWALITGGLEAGVVFRSGETVSERLVLALGALVSIALAVVLFIRPDIGAVALAQVYGLFSLVSGISYLITAARGRNVSAGSTTGSHVGSALSR